MSTNTKQFPLKSVEDDSYQEEEMTEMPARSKAPGSVRSPRPVQAASLEEESVFHVAVQVREEDLASWSPERLSTFFEAVNVLLMAKTHANIPLQRLGGLQHAAAGRGQADLQEFESRVAARLKEHEGVLAEMQRSANSTLDALRTELSVTRQRAADPPASSSRALNHIGDGLDAVEDRIKRIEATVDGVRRHIATLHESIAADFKDFETNLASHNAAILSARTAMSQTDDLVERVVEALEVLQTSTIQTPGCARPDSQA